MRLKAAPSTPAKAEANWRSNLAFPGGTQHHRPQLRAQQPFLPGFSPSATKGGKDKYFGLLNFLDIFETSGKLETYPTPKSCQDSRGLWQQVQFSDAEL